MDSMVIVDPMVDRKFQEL